MADSGYSGTPLVRKLGLKEMQCALFIDLPRGPLDSLAGAVGQSAAIGADDPPPSAGQDVVLLFAKRREVLARWLPALREGIARDGMIWCAWPKRASRVDTDITEDVVRAEALPLGLVDIKVCAIDQTWSGLKLVIRKELR